MHPVPSDPPEHLWLDARLMLRSIVDTSEDAIVTKNTDGVVMTWNASAERMFGYSAAEAVGRHVSLIIPEDRRDEEVDIMARLRAGLLVRRFETIRRRRDGSLVHVELSISPIRDSAGALVGASKIARDLTDRRRAEAALLAEESRFRTLADNISQLAWMADPTGWIFWYNRRWFEYTGTTLDQMQGWGWRAVHHADHVERVVSRIQHSWDTGEPWEDTFPLRGADGEFRWFLSRALPIRDSGGAIVRWFGTNTDITELLRLESELTDANRRKDTFLAMLSHELRNPLGAIRTSVAVAKASQHDPRALGRALDVVQRQSAHVARLVGDLLDVSRITSERLTLHLQEADLAVIVRDAVDMMTPAFESAGVALSVAVPEAPVPVRVDSARVQQMIGNLLSNAARYTPAGGQAWLTVTCEADAIAIAVRDTGEGIEPGRLEAIFELFVQGELDSRRHQPGLGIGLSLVRHLARLHGGSAWAESEGPGRGTTVRIRMPRHAAPVDGRAPDGAAPADDDAPAATPAPVRRVLLVDDDVDSVEAFAALLRLHGHHVSVATSGEDALSILADAAPHVIFVDIGLPGIDGCETCRRMRAAGVTSVIAALTGWGQQHDRRRTAEAGFDHHLVKPVDPAEVLALVHEDRSQP
ncbi:MAG: PAS domain S-box protein [Vicinamibacterales bacterium]